MLAAIAIPLNAVSRIASIGNFALHDQQADIIHDSLFQFHFEAPTYARVP
jgi:hypothetical protein